MGTELNFNPSLSRSILPTVWFQSKQGDTTLPHLITDAKHIKNDDVPQSDINPAGTKKTSTYETKDVSLASKIKEIQSLLGKKTSQSDAQQVEFQFAFEKSEEFYFQFSQRTKAVENNLTSVQKETYAEIRQKIAVQFKIGGSISGDALVGFQKTSEKFFNNPDLINSFLQIAQGLFAGGDVEQLNEFFEGLAGLLGQENSDTQGIDAFINRFLEQWLRKLFPSASIGDENGKGTNNFPQALSTRGNSNTSSQFQFQMEFKFEMSLEI